MLPPRPAWQQSCVRPSCLLGLRSAGQPLPSETSPSYNSSLRPRAARLPLCRYVRCRNGTLRRQRPGPRNAPVSARQPRSSSACTSQPCRIRRSRRTIRREWAAAGRVRMLPCIQCSVSPWRQAQAFLSRRRRQPLECSVSPWRLAQAFLSRRRRQPGPPARRAFLLCLWP